VGQFSAIERAINRKESMERKTMLREKLVKARDEDEKLRG
jgi:hypothetical protein